MSPVVLATLLLAVPLGLWLWCVVLVVLGVIPTWVLFVTAPVLVVIAGFVDVRVARAHAAGRDAEDPLLPWRRYRAAKALTILGESTDRCSLILHLVPEPDLLGPGVTLHFHGVRDLTLTQVYGFVIYLGYLVCEPRVNRKERKTELHVWDRMGTVLEFRCDSFEEVREDDAPAQRQPASAPGVPPTS